MFCHREKSLGLISTQQNEKCTQNTVGQVVISYTKGLAESFKHICGKNGIQVHFKGNITIKQVLMKSKD